MTELIPINYLDLLSIPELCEKNFFIPEYQRGYRWGEVQIRQLLEDLYTFFYDDKATGNFYCLQPVVVKEMSAEDIDNMSLKSSKDNNRWYEVVDGQQRLTTIKIILMLENLLDEDKELSFEIFYKTRPELAKFFSLIGKQRNEDKKYQIIAQTERKLDIDSWHIIKAAQRIIDWFQNEELPYKPNIASFKGRFYESFSGDKSKQKSVQVIWYELRDGSDPYDMFKRLNDRSISLNNAELIRGMLLSDSAKYKFDPSLLEQFNDEVRPVVEEREQARKQSHIIEMWDIIESQLRDEKFWAFIKDDNRSEQYSCRIEYIFDILAKKDSNQRDPLYTYLMFDKYIKDGEYADLWDLWLTVETYFSLLKSWFNDTYFYHKVGFIVAELGTASLIEMLSEATKLSKDDFKKSIDNRISSIIRDRRNPNKSILDYSYDENYALLKKVLFLFNVETTRQQGKEFFPFALYKSKDWTLEHIHAQNSERIDQSDKGKWEIWFKENEKVLKRLMYRLPNDEKLKALYENNFKPEYERFVKNPNLYSFSDLTKLFDLVFKYFDELNQSEDKPAAIHNISNMALLDGITNTSISNSVFEVKRQMILDADASGEYIPICTKKVFLKYYNKNEEYFTVQQNFYWSETDRQNYLDDIKRVLSDYIPEEDLSTPNEESEVTNE